MEREVKQESRMSGEKKTSEEVIRKRRCKGVRRGKEKKR